ncbi:hypothetical protein BP6252_09074 [Coleophoma cylindrospora]|uniref:Glucose-methanol-choline oxidoreductase N-terminal domain-containing protein n=1 Tax=Coleophoma cylindrospora TaxID=1849047 RepID=A0A3D8R146_9HELO|nr:hypothetical protein BP6252_09074 [Coleophoma cylindrospora]
MLIKYLGVGIWETVVNKCVEGGWIRGDAHDYDAWAKLVGDERWSYENMLPYMKKTETHWSAEDALPATVAAQHGFSGPVFQASVSSTGRKFPLKDNVKQAWAEIGISELPGADGNAGSPLGLAELQENRRDGLRQLSSSAYPLEGVTVLTDSLVKRVIFSKDLYTTTATGIELADGTKKYARKEVILSCGAYRTPQILMLSGIGPEDILAENGIEPVLDSPEVGANLWDHLLIRTLWKLLPSVAAQGVSMGSNNALFTEKEFATGAPLDWVVSTTLPREELIAAIAADEGSEPAADHPLLTQTRTFIETLIIYAAGGVATPAIPFDGSHISSTVIGLMPTSRGRVTISSSSPVDAPVIDPKYFSTSVDKLAMRTGLRQVAKVLLKTNAGKAFCEDEAAEGHKLILSATDAELEARVAALAGTTFHPGGTAAMGRVVDTELNVIGLKGLRVVDASVLPVPIASHLQVAVYALAEQAADIIGRSK